MPLFLGPGFRVGARWNRLVEAVKTRKQREKTGGKWATFWRWKGQRKKIRLPTLGSLAFLLPHLAVLGAVALRVASPTRGRCAWEIGLLTSANFVGWCLLVNLLMLQKTVGPFFIMCVFTFSLTDTIAVLKQGVCLGLSAGWRA